MKLREYQETAIDRIRDEWTRVRSTLLVLPTGCGKTIVFCKLAEQILAEGGSARILILAHREELIRQAADKMKKATGLECAVEKAEETAEGSWYRITVGSVQTLYRERRQARFSKDFYTHIIIDEAHHALSSTYQSVLDYFENAKVLGVTATPDRADKKNLGSVFHSLAFEYDLPQAIKQGYLSPIKVVTCPLDIDLGKISTSMGDYKASELDHALMPYMEAIVNEMKTYCADRKTIIFLPLIATSKKMQALLNANGFRAGEVNGESQDREQVLQDFSDGKYNVLCNSMLLTEGYDEPSVDCVICLRPTKSRGLYAQIIGRGTRLSPETGKEDLLVLDFLWHTDKLDLCRPAHLVAKDEKVAKKMTELTEKSAGVQLELEGLEIEAESEVVQERENSLAKKLAAERKNKRKTVDPVQYAVSINAEDLVDYVPSMPSEMAPCSEKQLAYLEKMGIYGDSVTCSGHASKIIDRLKTRQKLDLATPRQIRLLEQKGFKKVGQWKFDEASKMINRVAANRWRVPAGVDVKFYQPASQEMYVRKA